MPDAIFPAREPRRVRFDTRRRDLTVTAIRDLSPHMRRITLWGDMQGFQSLGFDDHVKLFFPDPATGLIAMPGGDEKPIARDYTPRYFDVAAGRLTLDFALHGVADGTAGLATLWAHRAVTGDTLVLGGPRGSTVWPVDYALHLLIGDETALPAIGRRLEELPAGTRTLVLVAVDNPAEKLQLHSRADATIHWLFRDPAHGGHALADAVARLCVTETDIFAWVAAEAGEVRQIRDLLSTRHGIDPQRIKASGYWQKPEAGE
ncbi:siderophore-interacting protein [Niveispirillum sp.]|uniref:siderophore-interacting protein n=1 Tax=Niveispirillum sp. TaxID=1917217 RepID=UPI001B447D45|nr:siderophore-interacting protein [Niveispirillum sp.]MBP7335044.1 siderophore-interacting protein [Niveispirillum sp.]